MIVKSDCCCLEIACVLITDIDILEKYKNYQTIKQLVVEQGGSILSSEYTTVLQQQRFWFRMTRSVQLQEQTSPPIITGTTTTTEPPLKLFFCVYIQAQHSDCHGLSTIDGGFVPMDTYGSGGGTSMRKIALCPEPMNFKPIESNIEVLRPGMPAIRPSAINNREPF